MSDSTSNGSSPVAHPIITPSPAEQPVAPLSNRARAALALALGALAFLLLPLGGRFAGAVTGPLIARGAVAGCVVGLLGGRGLGRRATAGIALVAAILGQAVLLGASPHTLGARGAAGALVAAALVALAIVQLGSSRRAWAAEVPSLVVVALVALMFAGVLPGATGRSALQARTQRFNATLTAKSYQFDGEDFLRTYHLMKNGTGYYTAFREGVTGDTRHDANYMQSPFNYREPLIFEIWRFAPGSQGTDLFALFVIWSFGTCGVAYFLARELTEPGAALLAPVALISWYSYFWWTKSWFTITEIWAALFVVAALWALVRKSTITSLVLLVLAVASRELAIVLVPAWLVAWWLGAFGDRRRSWWVAAVAVLAPTTAIVAHIMAVPPLSPGGSGLAGWLHGGPMRLVNALRFGWSYLLRGTFLSLAITPIALAGALLARPSWRRWALASALAVPCVFLLAISAGEWHYYWGAFFTPLAVALAPSVFGRLLPAAAPTPAPDAIADVVTAPSEALRSPGAP